MGLDNPDTLYFNANIRDDREYLVTGVRGTTADLSFQILNGDYSPVEVPDSLAAFDDRAIEIGEDGRFELRFGPARENAGPNYFTLGQGSSMLVVREVHSDWATERRGEIRIQCVDTAGQAPPVPDRPALAKRYGVTGKILLSRLKTFLAFPKWFYDDLPVNTMTEPRSTPGGLTTQFSSAGHYELGDEEAMVVTVPRCADAPYQGIQLGSLWYVSLDYINHQTSLTADQARVDPDGKIRFVISERDPGVANWLERTGHDRGYVQIRWQRLSRDLGAGRRPGRRDRQGGRPARPAAVLRRSTRDAGRVVGEDRGPAGRRRRPDAGVSVENLLQDKVVVVSGIGPGLGRSIAVRSALAGADVVLAARTESRLTEVAKEVTDLGRRAVAVRTDIDDEDSAATPGERGASRRSAGWTRWCTTPSPSRR